MYAACSADHDLLKIWKLFLSFKQPTSPPSELNDEQKKKCHKVLYDFLHGRLTDPVSEGIMII